MIPGFVVYKTFVALKNHFVLSSYDYVKYSGKISVKLETYLKRKDRYFFEKLGRNIASEDELKDHIIGNLVYGTNGLHVDPAKMWIGDMTTSNARDRALTFMARKQALDYFIKKDLTTIREYIRIREMAPEDQPSSPFPFLLTLYYDGNIHPETLIVLNSLQNLYGIWDGRMLGDPIWEKTKTFLRKYERLIMPSIDRTKYRNLYTQIFLEKENDEKDTI